MIVGLSFPYMNEYLGPYSFAPFALVLAFVFFFALTTLPETQGTTPDQLIAEMVKSNSQSVVYEVNEEDAGAIDLEWRKAMEQLMQEEESQMKNGTYGKHQTFHSSQQVTIPPRSHRQSLINRFRFQTMGSSRSINRVHLRCRRLARSLTHSTWEQANCSCLQRQR